MVQHKVTKAVYAMKVLKKHELLEDEVIEQTINEKNILLTANHPFMVGMSYVFQT